MENNTDQDDNENLEKKTIESTTTMNIWRRRTWEDLPHHLLELFLKSISEPIDRPILSLVCKAWRDFKPLQSSCFPALVHRQTIATNISSKVIQGVDEYQDRSCLGSCHGWLIIRMKKAFNHPEDLYYLLNIFTNDTMQLPVWCDDYAELPRICLSSPPTDPDCMLLMFDASFTGGGGFLLFSKPGWNKWIKSDCKYSSICYVFPFEGKFYALTHKGKLVAIDIIINLSNNPTAPPPTTKLTKLPVNSIFDTVRCECELQRRIRGNWMLLLPVLVESLGKLLAVCLYRRDKYKEIINLDVLELDFKTMSWIKVNNLPGDQVLFISWYSSFSISAGCEIGISNCIYVSDHVLGKIHRYDMHNQKMIVCTEDPCRMLWVKW